MSISGFFLPCYTYIFYLHNSMFSILSANDKKKIEKKTKKSFLIRNIDISLIYQTNKNNQKLKKMTTFQKTLNAYSKGQKSLAYLAFKNDSDSIKEITFEQFCIAFDKIIIQHKLNKGINPISKKSN